MQSSPTSAQISIRDALETAIRKRDSDLVETSLCEAFAGKLHPIYSPALIVLADSDWHLRQEDVVGALQELRSPDAVAVLERCTFSIHKHLAYDEFFGLARKCTWALADIGTPDAREALTRISNCDNPIIAGYAKKRLDNWEQELKRKV